MNQEPGRELVDKALEGDETALDGLVDLLTPVIQARVARILLSHGPTAAGDLRSRVEDLVQEIFLLLFDDGGHVLDSWRPEQGLSLRNFVGLVAQRRAISILRSGKRNPWREDPTLTDELDGPADEPGPEAQAAAREQLRLVLARLREELSPLGWQLFDLLFLRQRSVAGVQRETGMSADAIYAWRSRLRRLVRRLTRQLTSETD